MGIRGRRIYLCLLALFSIVYLVWRVGWTLPLWHGVVDMIFALVLLVTELLGGVEMAVHFMLEGGRGPCPETPAFEAGDLPDVDVFVPTCGEPAELVERTLRGCLAMEYPEGRVHIYLCDDADRGEMRALAQTLGVSCLARRERRDAKAGNLNAALRASSSPLVAVFDADMCPEPAFLLRTVPHFLGGRGKHGKRLLDRRVGFVQTPQDFRDEDLFQLCRRERRDTERRVHSHREFRQ